MFKKFVFLLLLIFIFSGLFLGFKTTPKKSNEQINTVLAEDPVFFANKNNVHCPPLPPVTENLIYISQSESDQLPKIVSNAEPGDTILLEDGVYNLNGGNLVFSRHSITLRSASGNPDAVIIDGAYKSTEIISIQASNITIAEVTVKRAYTHPIHIFTSDAGDTINTTIYRVNIIDPREQAIKINPHKAGHYVDIGTLACSSITLTDQGRKQVNPTAGGCYTGGVDAHQARDWIIRDNHIDGFWCDNGLSEYAIHFWNGSRDTVIERNVLTNNARGIGLGMKSSGNARTYEDNFCNAAMDTYIGHYGGIIRNNFIYANSTGLFNSSAGFDCGICFWSACNAIAAHNSIASTGDNFSSIEWRFKGSNGIEIYNNIATHALRQRNGASAYLNSNLENADLSLFVDGFNGNLHLRQDANASINKGTKLNKGITDFDIDGEPRVNTPDIGADEF